MHQKRFVLCSATALLAIAIACSKSPATPIAPASTPEVSGDAAPDGSTLKVPAPTPVSPISNAQPDSLVLVASKVTGKFDSSLNPSYQFEIRRSGAALSACSTTVAPGSGSTVSYTPTCSLEFDTAHTWRVRAVFAGAFGPWSSDAAFRSQSGGYINGNELFDPLTNGRTVGTVVGSVTFSGEGARLNANTSHVRYQLQQTLTAGEFSVMVKGADEGAPGDKTKVFSMQRGDDSDITTNSYRFTAELRGANYSAPGSITCRMIAGDGVSRDCSREQKNFDSTRWYFWKLTWNVGGSLTMEVREDGPRGRQIYSSTRSLSGRTYGPNPHNLYLGAPVGRAGAIDATLPGGVYKNLWVSSRPRPTFPGE